MKIYRYTLLLSLLIILGACTTDEGASFTPDPFYLSAPDAVEEDGEPTTFVIGVYIENTQTEDVTVDFELSGTATLDEDYSLSHTNSVVILAGENYAEIEAEVLSDVIVEEQETIDLTVTGISTELITINSSDKVIIGIIDNDE